MLKRIPKVFRNFYFITTFSFIVWMLFFDSNDFITQYQMSAKLSELEDTREDYQRKMEEVEKDRKALMGNTELLEKYAREKYLMKRPNEDVFIVVTKED
ncbi:FtsB family cell division protein [Pontibacter sp. MBLB2868]|uniref:FtsB family cell division protein n=1 Tax=Pontibacter sp. MBLB2868 TaxID=3451555 RepID=UPI003F751FD1